MSLLAEPWVASMSAPVCIVVVRDPVEVGFRFLGYNLPGNALTTVQWASAWEEYTARSLHGCFVSGAPTVLLLHSDLVARPVEAMAQLRADLIASGVPVDAVGAAALAEHAVWGKSRCFPRDARDLTGQGAARGRTHRSKVNG